MSEKEATVWQFTFEIRHDLNPLVILRTPGACIVQTAHRDIEYGLQEGLNPGDDLREIQWMTFERPQKNFI